jgi:hypothetical protein
MAIALDPQWIRRRYERALKGRRVVPELVSGPIRRPWWDPPNCLEEERGPEPEPPSPPPPSRPLYYLGLQRSSEKVAYDEEIPF